jgi:hypothetical protein
MMPYHVFVEGVGTEVGLRCGEAKLRPRHKPEQIAFSAAMGTIALHDLCDIALNLEGDPTAMATPLVDHRFSINSSVVDVLNIAIRAEFDGPQCGLASMPVTFDILLRSSNVRFSS